MRIGVIGAGQLAQMLAEAAQPLGLEVWVQTVHPDDPAVPVAAGVVSSVAELAACCDRITFENEFVDLDALASISGTTFYPTLSSLRPLLDKYDQRCFLRDLGIPVPNFTLGSLPPWDYPWVWKQRRLGYDGQGTVIIRSPADWQSVASQAATGMAEVFIPFERELAIMVARSAAGEIAHYPVVETVQRHQVCHHVIAPAALDEAMIQRVQSLATKIVNALEWVGMMGIELFLTPDQEILVNELAPRTHNSGHYTIDACQTSQFEQHLRAVAGLPLGSSALTAPVAVMLNLLGFEYAHSDYAAQRHALTQRPNSTVHWYGKTESRPGRKLGHVTQVLEDRSGIPTALAALEQLWYGTHPSK
ncbi:MAG: 5-(carboxyamino)imidazole ribonucleotide synthase [Synechococcales cyanobacterium]